jgi:hypothetical protein
MASIALGAKDETPMVVASEADIGRCIIYHRHEGPPITGVITMVAARRVFVRLASKPYSVAVSPVELDFIEAQETN